jgi:predicted outer membrane protein
VAEGYLPYGEQGSPVVIPRAIDDDAAKAREVISELLASHHKAIELSRIAESTTTDTEIRAFAEATTATNTAARDDLDNLLKSMGPVAKTPPGNTYDEREWRMKDVAEFNEDYIDAMVDVHEELIDLLDTAGKSEHSDLEAHARSSIAGIKLHLERAKLLEESRD